MPDAVVQRYTEALLSEKIAVAEVAQEQHLTRLSCISSGRSQADREQHQSSICL